MTDGEDNTIVKMCVDCHRLVLADTLTCPDCGGTLFLTVELDED